jgi:glycosyltransferase involved in cell wall biosynthesis
VQRLSVISPIFNAERYLEELLDSVAAIDAPCEHLVVDGASTDSTVRLLEARADERLRWVSEPDRGQTHAVNKGLGMATGDLLTWVNGDNAYVPGAVEGALTVLGERPDVDAVFGGIDIVDEDGAQRRRYIPPPYSWQRYLFMGDYIPTETIIFRRSLLAAAPALDERFVDAADYDFFLRLLHGRAVVRIQGPLLRYRYHPESKTARDPWLAQAEHMVIRRQWARGRRDLMLMKGFDRAKRAILPRISPWPRPYAP